MSTALIGAELECKIARSILASLAAGVRHEQPYRNWRLQNLFPETVARDLAELPFAPVALDGVSGRREFHNDARQYFAGQVLDQYPVAQQVAECLQSPTVVRAFAELTGAPLEGSYLRVEYAVDQDGFWLEPHTDLGVKVLTVLIQLPAEGQADLGTDIYGGPDDWRERAAFDWNGALMFVPSDRTWHGFEPRPIPGVRRSVILNYVTEDWRAREQLAYPAQRVSVG
jgi:hypothetical protein